MKNVIILGAGGNIAQHVIEILVKKDDLHLTLFVRMYIIIVLVCFLLQQRHPLRK
jgi:hypothetical protein